MKRHIAQVAAFIVLSLAVQAHALTIDWEHQMGMNVSSPGRWWIYSYDIGFFDNAIKVDVDIHLSGYTPADTLLNRWESGIESMWSTNRFAVPILFNVDWEDSWIADYVVNVVNDTGRWNMYTWYTGVGAGWGNSYHEEAAAHEFGHMIGAFDEYLGSGLDPKTHYVNTGGLMDTLNGPTLSYYYDGILDWYNDKLASIDTGNEAAPVPEPSTVLMLGAGLFALVVARKRMAV